MRDFCNGPVAINTPVACAGYTPLAILFSEFTAGAVKVQITADGTRWTDDTGTTINAVGRVPVNGPCRAFKVVQVGGVAPVFVADYFAVAP